MASTLFYLICCSQAHFAVYDILGLSFIPVGRCFVSLSSQSSHNKPVEQKSALTTTSFTHLAVFPFHDG